MRIIGNILWHVPFLGFVSALFVFLFGSLLILTVVAAPIGLGLVQFSKFLLKPFSYEMVRRADLAQPQNKYWKTYSLIVSILYFPIGLLAMLLGLLQVVLLCCTIVGIPVALVVAKSLGTYLNPVGKVCVPRAVQQELERRKENAQVEKFLSNQENNTVS